MYINKKYYFDTETLEFVPRRFNWHMFRNKSRVVLISSSILFFCYFIAFHFFESPFTVYYDFKKKDLITQSKNLENKIASADATLNQLHKEENKKFRMFLNMDKVPQEYYEAGYGGSQISTPYDNISGAEKLSEMRKRINIIQKQISVQKRTLNQVIKRSKDFNTSLNNFPYMVPVEIQRSHVRGPYGGRIDPITGLPSFHPGLDLICPYATRIYATGDGVVVSASYNNYGYGNLVEIDHGNGYTTRYAHMSKIVVRKGKKVKRGEYIGNVGSTGRSVGPHLHYEVRINGETRNPADYIPDNISVNDFSLIVKNARMHN